MNTAPHSLLRRSRRGANAIEFALTLPAFLLMLFGMIEYGGYFASQAMVDSVVTIGCREGAMLDPLLEDVPTITETRMTELVNKLPLLKCDRDCEITSSEVGTVPGRSLTCSVRVPYVGLTGWALGLPDAVGAGSLTRYEWQRAPTE